MTPDRPRGNRHTDLPVSSKTRGLDGSALGTCAESGGRHPLRSRARGHGSARQLRRLRSSCTRARLESIVEDFGLTSRPLGGGSVRLHETRAGSRLLLSAGRALVLLPRAWLQLPQAALVQSPQPVAAESRRRTSAGVARRVPNRALCHSPLSAAPGRRGCVSHGVGVSSPAFMASFAPFALFVVLGLSDRGLEEAQDQGQRVVGGSAKSTRSVVSELHASDFSASPTRRCHAVTGRWVARRTSFGRRVWRLA